MLPSKYIWFCSENLLGTIRQLHQCEFTVNLLMVGASRRRAAPRSQFVGAAHDTSLAFGVRAGLLLLAHASAIGSSIYCETSLIMLLHTVRSTLSSQYYAA